MKAEDVKIGKEVKYFPIVGDSSWWEKATITSEPYDIFGVMCCNIDITDSVVTIQSLEEYLDNPIKPMTLEEQVH